MRHPIVKSFLHEDTNTFTHVAHDPGSRQAAVIDAVLDYEAASGRTGHDAADVVIDYVRDSGLEVQWVIDTHVHADHLSAAPYIKSKLGGTTGIGSHIAEVQKLFGEVFNAGRDFAVDGSQFDHLFADGENYKLGEHRRHGIAHAGAYAGLHEPPHRRCAVRRRHPVHARLRHGTL